MSSAEARRNALPSQRDQRLDMFRGLALVMIFINHAPGTTYENWTNRNFGFSDAAEAFVFMSGMAAGLAYSGKFITANSWGSYWTAIDSGTMTDLTAIWGSGPDDIYIGGAGGVVLHSATH